MHLRDFRNTGTAAKDATRSLCETPLDPKPQVSGLSMYRTESIDERRGQRQDAGMNLVQIQGEHTAFNSRHDHGVIDGPRPLYTSNDHNSQRSIYIETFLAKSDKGVLMNTTNTTVAENTYHCPRQLVSYA